MNCSCFSAATIALSLILSAPLLVAADPAAAGQALVKRYADVIVGVELVVTVKLRMGDREVPPREQRIEVNGTVISPQGLTVTSLADVDPQVMFEAARAAQPGGRVPELVGADFKEVKLRLADGTEGPARFVLKDVDLDLAFIAPEASAEMKTFAYVDLGNEAEGAVLGSYYYVARAPKTLQRVPLIRATSVAGIVERPRRLFLMTELTPGTPVFDTGGKVLGLTLQNFANGRRTGYVVLPAADIAEMAKQASSAQSASGASSGK